MSSEEKYLRQVRAARAHKIKWTLIWLASAGVIVGLLWVGARADDPNNKLVARDGVHYHAKLSVVVNGEEQEIPSGIGLIAGMEHPHQMHTHEKDSIVHVEIPGRVYEHDMRLVNFFKVWGKDLSTSTVLGVVPTSTQKIFMTVNGKDEPLLGDYQIKDEDDIKVILR
jgi:hypothetical protein